MSIELYLIEPGKDSVHRRGYALSIVWQGRVDPESGARKQRLLDIVPYSTFRGKTREDVQQAFEGALNRQGAFDTTVLRNPAVWCARAYAALNVDPGRAPTPVAA